MKLICRLCRRTAVCVSSDSCQEKAQWCESGLHYCDTHLDVGVIAGNAGENHG